MPSHPKCALLLLGLAILSTACEKDPPLSQTKAQIWSGADIPCREAVERSAILNAPQLLRAAEDCASDGEANDSVFLLLAGQVRAMTDMAVLQPQTEVDEMAIGQLYGAIYYNYGGSGSLAMHRDADRFSAIIERLRNWVPSISDGYDPGWNQKLPVDRKRYRLMIDYSLRERVAKLEWYNNLVQEDRYFQAAKERDEILSRNNSRVDAGTDDANRLDELRRITDEINKSNPYEPPPLPRELQQDYTERDPEAQFKQLHIGFDGIDRNDQQLEIYESPSDVLASWLNRTLSPIQLASLLDEIDFHTESLIVLQLPPQGMATGTLYIRDIDYRTNTQGISVSAVISVNDNDCDQPPAVSYPFVVASVPRADFEIQSMSINVTGTGGGCQPPVQAQPTAVE